MRRNILLAFVAVAVAAPPAFANTPTPTRQDPLVCKRDRDMTLGTHFRAPRTCMLRSQWREMEQHTQNELQQIMDGQSASASGGNGGVQGLTRNPF